jgi:hypothetical protein
MPTEPGPASEPAAHPPSKHVRRLRLTAVCAALASALLVASYAMPWIEFPAEERERIGKAIAPGIRELPADQKDLAEEYRDLSREVVERGRFTGVDVYRYARNAHALNLLYQGAAPTDQADERTWQLQRALKVGQLVLGALPFAAVGLVLVFAVQRFRRAGTAALTLLVLAGCVGAAMVLAWMRFAEGFGVEVLTGLGMRLALAATLLQASIGLVGVSRRNWWRVYGASLASVGVLGVLAWAYVYRGLLP